MSTSAEQARLDALHAFALMDTPAEPRFDEITALVADVCQTPIALISLVDETRQWFKSRLGLAVGETPREHAFCAHALHSPALLIVPDAQRDPMFVRNPLVVGDPHVRFYAGAPLLTPEGHVLGTLCVMDHVPRELNERQLRALRVLSRHVMTEMQLMGAVREQDRLRAEIQMQNQELLEAQAVAHIGSWIADMETFDARWSAQTHQIFGTDASEPVMPFARFLSYVHPDDRDAVDRDFRGSMAKVTPSRIEHRIVHSSGTIRHVEERWRFIRDPDGIPIKAIGTCHDITERHASEQYILRLNRVYALLSGINDAIVHVRDRETLYAKVCEIAVQRGGLIAAWVGLKAPDRPAVHKVAQAGSIAPYLDQAVISWKDDDLGRGPTGTAIRTGRPSLCNDIANEPTFLPWRDAALAQGYRSSASFPLTRDDEAFGTISLYSASPGFFNEAETMLLEELAANVAFALHAIDQEERRREAQGQREQLEQQLLRAQRLESIGTLAGGIAHDLNNVLTPIIFSLDVLREGIADADLVPLVDEVERSARRGADMVRQLLAFARGGTGERRPIDVGAVLRELVATLRETLPKSIDVQAEIPADLPWVHGDGTQLHQVMLNLCVNARDAMPQGGTLRIVAAEVHHDDNYGTMMPDASSGPYLVIEVADTGSGMSAELLSRIFDPFFTTKAPGKGTGLGLSTTRSIVSAHGGSISVTSDLGIGTRFALHLPAIPRGMAAAIQAAAPSRRRGEGQSLLLVDDEAPIRKVGATILSSLGFQVTVAADGAEALELLRADPSKYDALITDLMMPVMDGLQLMREARVVRADLPMIASSGVHDDVHQQAVAAEGIAEFLAKPYSTESLLAALHRVLPAVAAA